MSELVPKEAVPEPQSGHRIRADRFDGRDWFGPSSDPIALLPPFIEDASYRRYRADVEAIAGLCLVVRWRIVGWPRRPPSTWLQVFEDGIEVVPDDGNEPEPDVDIEAAYPDFCRFQIGARRLRDFTYGSTVDGSFGGLASLAYLVMQKDFLRSASVNPSTHSFVRGELFDVWMAGQ